MRRKRGWLAACLSLVSCALFVAGTQARIVLPAGISPARGFDYLALDGSAHVLATEAYCSGSTCSLYAVPLDRSAVRRLAAIPGSDPSHLDLCGGDPGRVFGEGSQVRAANEGRALVYESWDCADGGVPSATPLRSVFAGPYAGPLSKIDLGACQPGGEFAISANYEAMGCQAGADGNDVLAVPVAAGAPVRRVTGQGVASLSLAGNFLAAERDDGASARLTITDLSTGTDVYALTASAPISYALGDDGSVVVGTGKRDMNSCSASLAGLAWYSPGSPIAHPLPYRVCGRMFLRSGTLVFEQPAADGLVTAASGEETGSSPRAITRYSPFGSLVDGDGVHVLVYDQSCDFRPVATIAPGGAPEDPGALKCPAQFVPGRTAVAMAANNYTGEPSFAAKVKVRCPLGCYFRMGWGSDSLKGTYGYRGSGTFSASTGIGDRGLTVALIRYQRALARFERARRHRHHLRAPKPPSTAVRVEVTNRDGTNTTISERVRLTLARGSGG